MNEACPAPVNDASKIELRWRVASGVRVSTTDKLLIDGLLTAGFGVQHSILATVRVKASARRVFGIEPLAWRSLESLANVLYILIAATLWQPVDAVIWHLEGLPATAVWAIAAAAWLWYWQLHLFEYDCGLAFGSTSLVARLAGQPMSKILAWKVGTRRWIRFPVHTAFFPMFFALPVMTADLLVLAIVLNVYNVIGSVLYDKRLEHQIGDPYKAYMRVTGLILPDFGALHGAANIPMAEPQHWRRPSMHVWGVLVGIVLGALYWFTLGNVPDRPYEMALVFVTGLIGAALSGAVIGRVVRPESSSWDQRQTDVSTTVALSAALGVIVWAGAVWVRYGAPPSFAAYLPLWFTVQYLGHVFAFLSDRRKWSSSGTPLLDSPMTERAPELAGTAS